MAPPDRTGDWLLNQGESTAELAPQKPFTHESQADPKLEAFCGCVEHNFSVEIYLLMRISWLNR